MIWSTSGSSCAAFAVRLTAIEVVPFGFGIVVAAGTRGNRERVSRVLILWCGAWVQVALALGSQTDAHAALKNGQRIGKSIIKYSRGGWIGAQ